MTGQRRWSAMLSVVHRWWATARRRARSLKFRKRISTQARSRWFKWCLLGLVALASYPITATTLLWSGLLEALLARDDLRVEIVGPAWSVLPGRLHLKALDVYVNEDTQVLVSLENPRLDVDLLALLDRHFKVTSITADRVRYKMRTRVPEAELDTARVRALPPLKGLPGDASLVKKDGDGDDAEATMKWTIQVQGIDVAIRELWFFQYRYLGEGRVRGGFLLGPERLRVDQSRQELVAGELRFGAERVLLERLNSTISAKIPEFNRAERGGVGVIREMNADVTLKAAMRSIEPLGAYSKQLRLAGGSGPLMLQVKLARGALERGSKLTYNTDELRIAGDGYDFKSDVQLTVDVSQGAKAATESGASGKSDKQSDRKPALRTSASAKSSYLSFVKAGKEPFTLQLHGHEHVAEFNSVRIDALNRVASARLKFPNVQTTDLDDLGARFEGFEVSEQSGKAKASLQLELRNDGEWGGPLNLSFDPTSVRFKEAKVRAQGEAKCWLQFNPKQEVLAFGDLSLKLEDVSFKLGDWDGIQDWWLRLSSDRVSLAGMPPRRYESDLSLTAKDAEPLLQWLAEKSQLPGVVLRLMKLSDLRARAKLRIGPDSFDMMIDALETSLIDVSGRVYRANGDSRLALVVGGDTISLGIHRKSGDTDFELQAGAPWLNRQLRGFPPPGDRVRSPKP